MTDQRKLDEITAAFTTAGGIALAAGAKISIWIDGDTLHITASLGPTP